MAEYGGIDAACTYHRGSRTLVDASAGLTVVEAPPALPAAISLDSTPAPLPTWAIAATPLSIRLDAFYNRLTTGPQTVGFVDGQFAPTARVDRTLGLAGSLVAATSHSAAVAPYVSLGAGFFVSHLNGDVAGSGAGLTPVTLDAVGLGVAAGGGVALRFWSGPQVLVDWRYHQALTNTRGGGFMPLSIGLRF
ncbi:MAG: hypothetical protein ACREOF_08975 [Gemmatimonadales bacterium]